MPTYEYHCKACGKELEAFHKMSDPTLTTCPACGKDELERLISGGNFVLKGGGWSKDNYGTPKSTRTENQIGDKMESKIAESKAKDAAAAPAPAPAKEK